jgi:hypothetical protein
MTTTKLNTIIIVDTVQQPNSLTALSAAPLAALKRCKPFSVSVMVYSPELGYKIEIEIEKNCTSSNEAQWKIVFKLSKKNNQGVFDVLVEVEFSASTPEENQGIAKIAKEGLTESQLDTINGEVYSHAKPLADERRDPTPQEKQQLDASVRKVVNPV